MTQKEKFLSQMADLSPQSGVINTLQRLNIIAALEGDGSYAPWGVSIAQEGKNVQPEIKATGTIVALVGV